MIKLVVVVGFAIAFAAGLVIGVELHQGSVASVATAPVVAVRPAGTTRPSGPNRSGVLEAGLNLTPTQLNQMNTIWSEIAPQRGGRGRDDSRRQLIEDRDKELLALYSPAEKVQYDQINQKYRDRLTAIGDQERQAFDVAVTRTMAILLPEQRAKYQEFLQQHRWPFGPGGRGRGRGGGPGGRGLGPRNDSSSTRQSPSSAAPGLQSPN